MNRISITFFLFLIGNTLFSQNFNLNSKNFKVGDIFIPSKKILFEYGKRTIISESNLQLDSIADFLKKHDSLIIEIGVHFDSRGSDKYSRRLDSERADSIKNYLILNGIASERISAKGYGKSKLIISDAEIQKMSSVQEIEDAHSINRRTEFKIIEIFNTRNRK